MATTRNLVNKKRKRGRPSITGKPDVQSVLIGVRLSPDLLDDLDRWRKDLAMRVGGGPEGRPEAIRAILEGHFEGARSRGLRQAAEPSAAKNSVAESAEMAGKAIDDVADQQATLGQRAKRKHRLLKGPQEFRKMREARGRRR